VLLLGRSEGSCEGPLAVVDGDLHSVADRVEIVDGDLHSVADRVEVEVEMVRGCGKRRS